MYDVQVAKNEILESGYFRIEEIIASHWGGEDEYPALLLIIHALQSKSSEVAGYVSELRWDKNVSVSWVVDFLRQLGLMTEDENISLFVDNERYIILIER